MFNRSAFRFAILILFSVKGAYAAAAASSVSADGDAERLTRFRQFVLERNTAFRNGEDLRGFTLSSTALAGGKTYALSIPPSERQTTTESITFSLSPVEARIQERLFHFLAHGLPEYGAEHKKDWNLKYSLAKIGGDRLLPAVAVGVASLTSFYATHSEVDSWAEVKKIGGAVVTGKFVGGLLSDAYECGCYHLGFSPAIFKLNPEGFSQELEMISLLGGLSIRVAPGSSAELMDRIIHILSLKVLEVLRVTPSRRSFLGHCFTISKSAIVDSYRYYRGYRRLGEDATRSPERGTHYFTQLNKVYRNLPSFNLFFDGDYDIVMPNVREVFRP